MCGIAGIVNCENSPIDKILLSKMCNEIRHRGPDDEGYALYSQDDGIISSFGGYDTVDELMLPCIADASKSYNVGFGFRRLSIVDLTDAGHQPMVSENRRYMMVFNGEIYNYRELRKELEDDGIVFTSDSDSEVVLKAYEKWGHTSVDKFNGMWAICIFDTKDSSLFCSRDRFGIKPLYYYCKNGTFIFASEIKQLLLNKQCSRALDESAATYYLVNGIKDYSSHTMFNEVSQLEPGCNLIFANGEILINKYWDFSINDSYMPFDGDEDSEKDFLKIFTSAVKLRLKADVAVGVALSGGIDSSSITVMANEISEMPLMTFSVVFDQKQYDERNFSNIVANNISCVRHEVKPSITKLINELDEFIAHMEEPVRSISTYSQWCLMRCVRENGVTVLLEGQGADELLGGYEWYFDSYFSDLYNMKSLQRLIQAISSYKKNYRLPFHRVLIEFMKAQIHPRVFKRRNISSQYNPEVIGKLTTFNLTEFKHLFCSQLDFGLRYQIRELLNYGDKSSMRFSVENRVPFLDYRLVEFATQLPLSRKIRNGDTKQILRESLCNLLPSEIKNRYSKLGYSTPQELWQRNELRKEIEESVLNSGLLNMSIFDSNKGHIYFSNYFSNRHNDYSFIWRCYNFAKWMKHYDVTVPSDSFWRN